METKKLLVIAIAAILAGSALPAYSQDNANFTNSLAGRLPGLTVISRDAIPGSGSARITRQMSLAFKEACGAVTCKELKGVGTGRVLCACDDCVRNAVQIYGKLMALD